MDFTLQQLRVFEAIAHHKSFTKAAEAVHLTQPAVSIAMKRFEETVGLPLVERIGKKIYLTRVGEAVAGQIQVIRREIDALGNLVLSLQGGVQGPLHVAGVTTSKYFMPHLLGAFVRRYPGVRPSLLVINRAQVLQRLAENQDDLVIMGQVPQGLPVETFPFLDNSLVVVGWRNHPLAGRRNIPLRDLLQQRFLSRESGSGTRAAVDQAFRCEKLVLEPYMELGSSEAIKQAVIAGLGISVLSGRNIRPEVKQGLLQILDVAGFPLQRHWYAVYPKGKQLSQTAESFRNFLRTEGPAVLEQKPSGMDPPPAGSKRIKRPRVDPSSA
ncbi:LysR family transcriptional regulator [Methylacidimicrobium tartarophylax]|uniref:HTH-type transcriptional activator CmpR n=1 Tax=Methylacidimicrobium tartarophylax TaxID=1041768 RepID=A0A5E6MMA2_9BACT|nr:LysR family transcriptional regulator [Methylacidimicrobium tartarophylax]VVM07190.1 HTH-type transcriptional activator CmpR [Methylacidimicrobium tartarophylax]